MLSFFSLPCLHDAISAQRCFAIVENVKLKSEAPYRTPPPHTQIHALTECIILSIVKITNGSIQPSTSIVGDFNFF